MEIIFFGTSAGVITKERFTSAIGLKASSSSWILFDAGEGTQIRILQSRWSIGKLKYIFLTHLHGDHCYGIFGLLALRGMMQISKPLFIFAPEGFQKMLEAVMRASSLHLPFELKITQLKENQTFDIENLKIKIVKMSHSIESFGFVIDQEIQKRNLDVEKLKSLGLSPSALYGKLKAGEDVKFEGKLFKSKDFLKTSLEKKRIIIGGDNDSPEKFIKYSPVDLMIHEATYTQKDFDKLPKKQSHTTAKNLAIAAKKANVKKLIITHISPRYKKEREKELIDEAKKFFDEEVILARDLLELAIP
jgi:ribonuclease Z